MLKTSIDKIAKPAIPLFLLGSLKGYISSPYFTFARIILGLGKAKKHIDNKYPKDLRKLCALMLSSYTILLKSEEKDKALRILKAMVLPMGLAVQMANFRYVEDMPNMKNLIQYQQRTNKEGPTRMNSMEIIMANNNTYEFKVSRCCFYEIFNNAGFPELTSVFCEIDNAIFNVYLPDSVIFHRKGQKQRITDGAEYCTFFCEKIH
jgi:hypothetical protein